MAEGAGEAGGTARAIVEPQRRTPVVAQPDVLVVGGGAAGIAAACAAARGGAATLLVERFGFLGGTLTAVTLGGFCGTHAVVDERRLARVVGGLYLELEDRLRRRGAVAEPARHGRILGVPYDSACLKLVADELLAAHGVPMLLHSRVAAVQAEGRRVTAVIVENKGGRAAILPGVVVDCSGDGDVAAFAGAGYSLGDGGRTQAGSTMFRLAGVDTSVAGGLTRARIRELLEQAVADGYPLPRTATGVHLNPLEGIVHLNVTRLVRADGSAYDLSDPDDLTEAERVGRAQAFLYEEVFRRYVPGFAQARIVDIGAMVGIRETRLIRGEEVLTEEAVRRCVKPANRIACTAWPLEKHEGGRGTSWEFLPDGDCYGIPYGCLVVKGYENLLVAGRNLSATHAAQASARVAGPCFAMGEAAGAAAALAVRLKVQGRQVPVDELQRSLEEHGAILTPCLE